MDEFKPKTLDSAEERGKRIRYVREELLHISRNKFANRHSDLLSKSVIQNWEDGRYGGLTEKGAKKIIQAFSDENIDCNLQWLLYGTGNPPRDLCNTGRFSLDLPDTTVEQRPVATDDEAIDRELRFFKAIYGDTMDMIVRDNGLSPFLSMGDHVAGIRWSGKEINQAIGQLCIIQTYEGLHLTRKLEVGSKPGYYNLVCTNFDAQVNDLVIRDVKLFSVASIAWVRKPLKNNYATKGVVAAE